MLLVIGNVIGSAIYLTSGVMAERLPSPTLLMAAWAVGGVLALAGALTYAEMGAMFPRSGGLYVFLTEAYGPLLGFLYGWAALLVVLSGGVATVAVGFAEYFSYFFPMLSTSRIVGEVPLPWGSAPIGAGQLVAASSLAVLGAVNYAGLRYGNALQAALTALKVFALVLVPIVALAVGRADQTWTTVVPPIERPVAAFGVVMIAVMWAYEGWYYLAFAAGEVKDARRTVPRALVLGTLALTGIYLTMNLAYFQALSLDDMRGVPRIAERAVTALVGDVGGALVAATVAISALGCNAAAIIGMSRVCYAMAADGRFLRAAASVHPRYRTPHVAIVLTCAWAAFLTLTGTYEQLFTYVTFASVLFFVSGGLALVTLRWRRPGLPRPYRVWGYPAVPIVFVLGSSVLVINTLIERPVESTTGLGLVALGLPVYWWMNRDSGFRSRDSGP